jgi:hypothetical protein
MVGTPVMAQANTVNATTRVMTACSARRQKRNRRNVTGSVRL